MRPDEEDDFSRFLSRQLEPFVYDRHVYLPDWERLGARPSLVNMVREPTARFVSQFFYLRARQRWRGRRERPPPTWFSKSLDRCVLGGDLECGVGAGSQDLQLTYFCGSSIYCANATARRALLHAERNVEKW